MRRLHRHARDIAGHRCIRVGQVVEHYKRWAQPSKAFCRFVVNDYIPNDFKNKKKNTSTPSRRSDFFVKAVNEGYDASLATRGFTGPILHRRESGDAAGPSSCKQEIKSGFAAGTTKMSS